MHFDVLFRAVLDSNTAQEGLIDGLKQGDTGSNEGLVIDSSSVQISGTAHFLSVQFCENTF